MKIRFLILLVLFNLSCEAQIVPIISSVNSGAPTEVNYSDEAEAVFTNIETGSGETLTLGEKTAIARFIDEEVALGNWSEIYSFIINSGLSTSAKARVDWKTGVQATTTGSPTYSPTTGFTTNGSSSYENTLVNPSTIVSGGAVDLNDVAYSIHIIDNITSATMGVIGTTSTGQVLLTMSNAGAFAGRHHRSSSNTHTDAIDFGLDDDFYTLSRGSSVNYRMCKDSQSHTTESSTSQSVPVGRTIYVGALNNNGTASNFGEAKYGTFMINKHSTFDRPKFFAHWEILMMELNVKAHSVLYPLNLTGSNSSSQALLCNFEGQSNGAFCGNVDTAPTPPAELVAPIVGADVFWREVDLSDPTVDIETLEFNVNNTYSSVGLLDNYGAGLRAAYEIANRQEGHLYIWHFCISARALTSEHTIGWHPDLAAQCFDKSHLSIAAQGIPLISEPITKIVWHWSQGESDATNTYARTTSEYRADFYYYLSEKLTFLEGQGIDFDVTEFHAIIAEIYFNLPDADYATTDDIRAAQESLSVAGFEAAYPSHAGKVRSLILYNNDRLLHDDDVHMNPDSYMIEGYRLGMYISRIGN